MRERFTRVEDPDSTSCEQALTIYEASFPAEERQPVEVIRERIAAGQNQLYVAEDGGKVVFFALLWPLARTDFTLLDYLATAPDARGQGWGSRYLEHLFADFRARREFVLLEVEDPDFGPNRKERTRRRAFYKRSGALELNGVRYLLPPLQGSNQSTEMRLMVSPNYRVKTIDAAAVRGIVTRLYGRPAGDPLLQSFLVGIKDPISLR